MEFDVVIVAAGSGSRFGGEKLFADLCGMPVVAWPLAAFAASPGVARIVVVAAEERREAMAELGRAWAPAHPVTVVAGGNRRRDSVEAGLHACRSAYVAIHDGARPLVDPALIARCAAAAEGNAGAIAAMPVVDTIKEAQDGFITGHPAREGLFAAQTPQFVLRERWLEAAALSDEDETDDAAMLARLGLHCAVAEGDPGNIKVTRPLDLETARAILRARGVRTCE